MQIFIVKSPPAAKRAVAWINDFWEVFSKKDTPFVVEIYPRAHRRTKKQNWRYWNVILRQIEEKAWFEGRRHHRAWWHSYYALMFNPTDDDCGNVVGGATSELEIVPFNRYMHSIEQHAIEVFGVEFDDDYVPLDFSALETTQ